MVQLLVANNWQSDRLKFTRFPVGKYEDSYIQICPIKYANASVVVVLWISVI